MKSLYVDLKGGLGFNIAFVRVAKCLINKGYKINAISPYWDILASADINYYKPNEYRDFIFDAKNENGEIIENRIYDMSDFIYKKLNYKDAWLKLMNIKDTVTDEEYNTLNLDIYNSFSNLKNLEDDILNTIKQNGFEDFMLVQFWGGQTPLVEVPNNDWSKVPYDYQNEPLKRHYPIKKAQEFVNLYRMRNPKTAVIQYSLPNEPRLEGVFNFTVPYLVYYELSKKAKEAVTIDSSLQHLITGNCPLTVLWGHSLPSNFGYSCNNNIIQECRRDDILYFTALGASGAKIEYIEPNELIEKITKKENNVTKEEKKKNE